MVNLFTPAYEDNDLGLDVGLQGYGIMTMERKSEKLLWN